MPLRDAAAGAAPALLLALFALRAGTLEGATEGFWVMVGHAALFTFAAVGVASWRDPLRLGPVGSLLAFSLVGWTALTCALSPVSRAGWVGALVLPAFFLVPPAVAHCWSTAQRRAIGMIGLVAVLTAVSAWSLAGWAMGYGERPALPLGHHNLLATFVVLLLPTAMVLAGRRGRVQPLAIAAAVLAVSALFATRSLAGLMALVVVALIATPRRFRLGVVLAVGAAAFMQAPRLLLIVHGEDGSVLARLAYARAALDGIASRPMLGWGPGAVPWTLAEHLPPQPGILPAGQVIGHVHNLPLHLAYEIGMPGLALVLALVTMLAWRHTRRAVAVGDQSGSRAAAWGLLAGCVASLGGLPLTVTALPLTVAVLLGLLQATTVGSDASITKGDPLGRRRRWQPRSLPALAVLMLCAVALARLDLGHRAYDKAVRAPTAQARQAALDDARRLDPSHPLYQARWAWQSSEAEAARGAAIKARGVASLWLAAGSMGLDADAPWADDALVRACDLDPLGPMAPFLLALDRPEAAETTARLARAWAAEPRLLAATALRRHPWRAAAVDRLNQTEGLDHGWRSNLVRHAATVHDNPAGVPSKATLALSLDGMAATSQSLFAFRRAPWPADLVTISLDEHAALSRLGAAAQRGDTASWVFGGEACTLGRAVVPPGG